MRADPEAFANEKEFQHLAAETFDQVLATTSDAPALVAREVVMPDDRLRCQGRCVAQSGLLGRRRPTTWQWRRRSSRSRRPRRLHAL